MSNAKKPVIAYTMTADTAVTGLSVRTMKATGVSSYVFDGRVNGVKRRFTIGRTDKSKGGWTLKAARIEARRLATDYDKGIDPKVTAATERAAAEAKRIVCWKHSGGRHRSAPVWCDEGDGCSH
jgi:hypothetical protein